VSNRRVQRFHQESCIAQVHDQGLWSAELRERRNLVLELELHLILVFLHWRTICKQKVQ
jgi:hypothetical protein